MSSASPPRTSPTMIRSGRIRSAFRTRSRMRTSPSPSTFGGLDSSETTCRCWSRSSAASSTVTIRSPSGIDAETAFRSVVLPVPVPPEIRMFSFPRTHSAMNCADCSVIVPSPLRSASDSASRANFRIVSDGPRRASGGMIALTRLPSGRRASTIGDDSSIRRPTWDTMRSMIRSRCASSRNDPSDSSSMPARSMKTWS